MYNPTLIKMHGSRICLLIKNAWATGVRKPNAFTDIFVMFILYGQN